MILSVWLQRCASPLQQGAAYTKLLLFKCLHRMMKESMFGIKKIQANTLIYRLLSVIIRHKSCNPVLISALFYLSQHKQAQLNIV